MKDYLKHFKKQFSEQGRFLNPVVLHNSRQLNHAQLSHVNSKEWSQSYFSKQIGIDYQESCEGRHVLSFQPIKLPAC